MFRMQRMGRASDMTPAGPRCELADVDVHDVAVLEVGTFRHEDDLLSRPYVHLRLCGPTTLNCARYVCALFVGCSSVFSLNQMFQDALAVRRHAAAL
jgi:hypothetical protein